MHYPKLFSPKALLPWLLAALFAVSLGALPAQAQPFAYVANENDYTVSVIDVASNTVVATVPVGFAPSNVAITPDGAFAYVTGFDLSTSSGSISVIATASNTVVATVPLGLTFSFGVAITPDGAFAYVANSLTNDVSVIATASNTVVATVPVGTQPFFLAITPDGAFAYVTNAASGNVSVIAIASNTVVATVPVGAGPVGIAITPGLSVEDLIDDLIAEILSMNIDGGVGSALISKLENALANFQTGDTQGAIDLLNAFINQCNAQRGKKLTNAQADDLIAAAQALIDQISSSAAAAVAKTSTPAVHAAAQTPSASEIRFKRSESGGMTMMYFAASGQELRTQSLAQEQVATLQQRFAKHGESNTPALPGLQVEKLMQVYTTVLAMAENGDEVILTLPKDGKDFKITKAKGSANGQELASLPTAYTLEQNYPNPFNPETEIRFALPEAGLVTVKIFNTTGQEVRTLANAPFQAGYQTLRWDGRDQAGNALAAGVYLYQITATGANGEVKFSATKRMAFVK